MKKAVAIILILLGYLLFLYGYLQNKRPQVAPIPTTPTLYDITLECQKLAAQSMDKYRMEEKDGKKVMITFGYESCVNELKKSVNSGQTIQML